MRMTGLLLVLVLLAGCSYSDGGGDNRYTCSLRDQKRFVRDATLDWYLWNDLLPDKVSVGDYDDPVELLADLTRVQPLDTFSFIGSAAADAAFFGAGQFIGFGFSWTALAADDIRLTRVFSGSPAAQAGFKRGQRIVALDGRSIAEIDAAEGISAVLSNETVAFTLRETDGVTEFTVTVTADLVTIDPVPQWRQIPRPGSTPIGYLELATFVATAEPQLDQVFADFVAAGVTDVVLDLRYNLGGLVATAETFGDLLGGDVAENLTFTRTLFNSDRSAENDREEFFERLGNSISLSRLVVIATPSTASASELLINAMEPHVEVTIVGDDTFGKPVGQVGFEFCGNILRLTAFQTVNADGFGDYFGGLPADCPAADDLSLPVGASNDPSLMAARTWLDTGACPAAPGTVPLTRARASAPEPAPRTSQSAWREFANAW